MRLAWTKPANNTDLFPSPTSTFTRLLLCLGSRGDSNFLSASRRCPSQAASSSAAIPRSLLLTSRYPRLRNCSHRCSTRLVTDPDPSILASECFREPPTDPRRLERRVSTCLLNSYVTYTLSLVFFALALVAIPRWHFHVARRCFDDTPSALGFEVSLSFKNYSGHR